MPIPATDTLPILRDDRRCAPMGALCLDLNDQKIKLPLKSVDIKAQVVNRIASVTVTQVFSNTSNVHQEAVYIFPLSGGCAVSKFEMKIKDRVIVGLMEERQQARRDYQQALKEGRRAALMEQERDDVFTMNVGNLPPNEDIEITLIYAERLPYYESGKTEIRLPLVIGQRYTPGTPVDGNSVGDGVSEDTDIVRDASRISPPRLASGVDAGLALSISVDIETGGEPISDISCSQHATSLGLDNNHLHVTLSSEKELMNRDFVLNWRLAGPQIRSKLYVKNGTAEQGTFAMLTVVPPRIDGFTGVARDVIFLLDRSGSMGGIKMSSAVRACSILLETLSPRDRFSIVAFDDRLAFMGDKEEVSFFDADEDGLRRGHKFLRQIEAHGGTELWQALQVSMQALEKAQQKETRMPIIVVLTDGQVSDESRILQSLQKELKDARVFTVGIDTAPNTGLLKRLAQLGGGTCSFVTPGTQLESALIHVGREIGAPLITDLKLELDSSKVSIKDLVPQPIPDLFAGRAVNIFFRIPHEKLKIKLTGKHQDNSEFQEGVTATITKLDAVRQLWAKSYVTALEDTYRSGSGNLESLKEEIIKLSKEHTILTKFTAFIAVDKSEITNQDGSLKKVVQPVHEPAGWEDQTITGSHMRVRGVMPASAMAQRSSFAGGSWNAPPAGSSGAPSANDAWGAAPQCQPAMPSPSSTPTPRQSPAHGGGGPGYVDWLGKTLGWNKNAQAGSPPSESQFTIPSTGAPESLKQVLLGFCSVLQGVFKQMRSGHKPDCASLSTARRNLMDELANYDDASNLPLLQKYLRVSLPGLIAALSSDSTSSEDLADLLAHNEKSFATAMKETEQFMRLDIKSGGDERFWESSI